MALPKQDRVLEVSELTKKRYFKNLAAQIQDLRKAMEKSDINTVREICHKIRGSAGLFGLKDLGEACRSMEEAAIEMKLDELVECFQIVEVIVTRNSFPTEA